MHLNSAALSRSAYIQPRHDENDNIILHVTCNWCNTTLVELVYFELPDVDWVADLVKHLREDCAEVPKNIDTYEFMMS